MACTSCAIGKRKKHGSRVGAYDMEKMGMKVLEVGVGALAGSIATLEMIRMVPSTTINSDIRDGLLVLTGLAVAAFVPDEYEAGGIALGAGIAGVAGMNAYMRHFATPGIGKPRNPALGKPRNPALGARYTNTNSVDQARMNLGISA